MSSRQADHLLERSWKSSWAELPIARMIEAMLKPLMHSAMRQIPWSLAAGPVSHVAPHFFSLRHPIVAQAPIHGG
jgi:hypothetical protein